MTIGRKWDLDTRMNAAFAYSITGSAEEASKLCGVPPRTIKDWSKTDWFPILMQEVRAVRQDELDGQFTGALHKAVQAMGKRIEQGDAVYNARSGEVTYVPVKLRDLAFAAAVMMDKRATLRVTDFMDKPVDKTVTNTQLDELQAKLQGTTISDEEEQSK